jgi:DNA repair protein RecO (recombination protein O)
MNKQTGFLLSYLKYGDNDAVLHCFSKEAGFQSFFVRGIYSPKNKKKAYLMPLNELSLSLSSHHSNAKLPVVQKIEICGSLDFYTDVKQSSVIFFVSDFLNQTLKNEQANASLYSEIEEFRRYLNKGNLHSYFIFLIRILNVFGIAPLISEEKFLSVERGLFQNDATFDVLDVEISEIWKNILKNNIEEDFRIDKHYRKKLLDSILLYYKIHFPEFYTPKSLQVITQLFE